MEFSLFEITFWILLLIVFYIYCGYPITLYLLSIFLGSIKKDNNNWLPLVTIFIAVHNEETVIKQKIENTLELDYPNELLEIIVASDGSTDGTNDILKLYQKKGITAYFNDSNEGKNAVINKYAPLTKGDIIVFTDANSMFLDDALINIVRNFSDPQIGCVGGMLKYLKGESAVSKGEGLYFKYENFIRKYEGLRGRMIGSNGAIYAIRKSLFIPVPFHVPNDFFHPLSVLKNGFYNVFEEDAIALEKPSEHEIEEFNRRARIVARSFGALIEVNKFYGIFKGKGWFYLIFHKILRWFGFPILIVILILNVFLIQKTGYFFTLLLQIMLYAFGILGYVFEKRGYNIKVFYVPYYFLLINIAGVVGLYNYFRGQKVTKWKIASTTR